MRMARLTAALLSLLTLGSEGLAQAPADEQLFINARIITGDGSIIENGCC